MVTNAVDQEEKIAETDAPTASQSKAPEKKIEEGANDLISKVFPSLVIVVISAIFYYTGWVYISHWYSYYGVDATMIEIPLQLIILHGFPGILLLGISGLAMALGMAIYREYFRESSLQFADLPYVAIFAYLLSLIIVFSLIFFYFQAISIPAEVWVSSSGAVILVVIILLLRQVQKLFQVPPSSPLSIPTKRFSGTSTNAYLNIMTEIIIDNLSKRNYNLIKNMVEGDRIVKEIIEELKSDILGRADLQSKEVARIVRESWRFWISAILLFYFLVSISASAIFGELDAARGGRFMVGNWRIPEVSLYASEPIPALSQKEQIVNTNYVYRPLGLLASDDNAYYLVDSKPSTFYTRKPNLYIVPRSDSLSLNLIVSPR